MVEKGLKTQSRHKKNGSKELDETEFKPDGAIIKNRRAENIVTIFRFSCSPSGMSLKVIVSICPSIRNILQLELRITLVLPI